MRVKSKHDEMTIILAKLKNKYVHTIEPDQREYLSVLSCINVDGGKFQISISSRELTFNKTMSKIVMKMP